MPSADLPSTSLSLLSHARRREEGAWCELVRIYGPLVVHWCRQSGVRSADIDDIAQNVFIAVSAHLDRFGQNAEKVNFRGWLWTITRSKVLDHHRKDRMLPIALPESQLAVLDGLCQTNVCDRSTEEARGDLILLVNRTLSLIRGDFSERTWTAFWRVKALGESPSLVAKDLGMTIAAVCMSRSRVLRRLRDSLQLA
jgi:RNA polymerase sigma-70 factor (ECF subfamily)